MTPQQGLPDLVFTANAGLMFGQRFFSSQFRHAVRASGIAALADVPAGSRRTASPVEHLPDGMFFEGLLG